MELRETAELIKQQQQSLLGTKQGVQQAKNDYKTLSEEIRKAHNRLRYKKSTRHAETYSRKVLQAMRVANEFKAILMNEIEDALIRSGPEFEESRDLYRHLLQEVVNSEDTYLMPTYGSGWAVRLAPQILFEHAGSLHDYARGITAYRQQLKTKIGGEGSNRGIRATNWWLSHVFTSSLYKKTVLARVQLSGRQAPFWSLIAHGSTDLQSDRPDSSFNPLPAQGVNFILFAEETIERRFKEYMNEEKALWTSETQEFEDNIREAEAILREMDDGIKNLKVEYEANRRILAQFGEAAKYVDQDKLAIRARQLRAGEEFETERIELTAAGMGKIKRVRPTVEQLRRMEGIDY